MQRKLSKAQRRWLAEVLRRREKRPSDFRILGRLLWKGWLPLSALVGAGAALTWAIGGPSGALVLLGIPIGLLVPYLDLAAVSSDVWSLTAEVLDWQEIERIAVEAGLSPTTRASKPDEQNS